MTPDNSGYAWAAYIIVLGMFAAYVLSIWIRGRRARSRQGDA